MSRHGTCALVALSFAGLAWGACGEERAPSADVPETETAPAEPAEPPAPDPVHHEVGEGETLWDIARAYDVGVAEIMEANELRPGDVRRLSKGRTLVIPGATEARTVETATQRADAREELPPLENGAYHFLADGETIWDLARTYDKSVDEIMEANEITDDDVRSFRTGRPVIIPGVRADQIRASAPREETTRDGIVHEVVRGETIWDLAMTFQVSVSELMAVNGLSEAQATALREGARIFVPGVTEDVAGRVHRQETATQRRARPNAIRLGLGTRRAASDLLRGVVRPAWIRAAGGNVGRLPGTLRWPVTNGWFVRGYGSGEEGYHLATDIAGEMGWNVRAAAPGIVGYSGDEVSGYGNMVLVIHPGGWVTMYAHNSVNFVVAGERVARGGILAELGSTGISRGPHVHFELIHGGRNCDPSGLFRPGIRHRDGHLTPLAPIQWRSPDNRPRGVACAPRRRFPRSRWVVNE